ncbi:MAG: peptidylprolyl isomerase [Zhengella sp.]|uniref:FKBP-type peptidyl-prolyl cis-trans isomerase n=1 Tax=Zhengella sp. TaxID=2282762 RepID=UPI001D5B0213|nr:peptidylprolyl isomerase [Notoacmeibacter sp.]MCC0025929.1 peptidylprolyl isomerase [Brucellaceae bacterium]
MTTAKNGDTVKIHYTGTLSDGTKFDSSDGRDPLSFQLGAGQIIPGLEKEIAGMAVGDQKTVTVAAADAYGQRDPQQVQQVPRNALPPDLEPQVGMQLQAQTPNGVPVQLIVIEVAEDTITVDANHPLAGHDLTFAVEMVEIG